MKTIILALIALTLLVCSALACDVILSQPTGTLSSNSTFTVYCFRSPNETEYSYFTISFGHLDTKKSSIKLQAHDGNETIADLQGKFNSSDLPEFQMSTPNSTLYDPKGANWNLTYTFRSGTSPLSYSGPLWMRGSQEIIFKEQGPQNVSMEWVFDNTGADLKSELMKVKITNRNATSTSIPVISVYDGFSPVAGMLIGTFNWTTNASSLAVPVNLTTSPLILVTLNTNLLGNESVSFTLQANPDLNVTNKKDKNNGPNTEAIAGIVIGVIGGVVLLLIVIFVARRHHARKHYSSM